ncbi:MAG TPA: RNA-binding S4 domain-containing protein [Verrucomicrobiae bacterium]|jgi:ribosome-associated heat shock protein Hsp15
MNSPAEVRLDKWLWAVRLYQTRTSAADAIKAGHVKIAGRNVKPSHRVKCNEIIAAQIGELTRTIKVLALLERRIGAKLVRQFLEDLTPASEYDKPRQPHFAPLFARRKGQGRPTKKERRDIGPFLS